MKFCVVWSVVSSNSDQAEKTLRLEPPGLICRPFLIPQLSHITVFVRAHYYKLRLC